MVEIIDIIKGRWTIRKYQEKQVPEEILQRILEPAHSGPSWAEFEVIVVKNRVKKERPRDTLFKTNPAKNAVVQAPVVLSMGLGTVIVGNFDHNKAKEGLEVPRGYELVALIPLGYPAENPAAPKRREITEFIHYDKY